MHLPTVYLLFDFYYYYYHCNLDWVILFFIKYAYWAVIKQVSIWKLHTSPFSHPYKFQEHNVQANTSNVAAHSLYYKQKPNISQQQKGNKLYH